MPHYKVTRSEMPENLPIRLLEERPVYPEGDELIDSRRFGTGSLGINLARGGHKRVVCNMRCHYCQYEVDARMGSPRIAMDTGFGLHGTDYVKYVLDLFKEKLMRSKGLTAITFSGNCEPTINPHFSEIAKGVKTIRDDHGIEVPINIFTNGTTLGDTKIACTLEELFDNVCIKVDAPTQEAFSRVNNPFDKNLSLYRIISDAANLFTKGKKIVQTMVVKDDTFAELGEYEALLRVIKPDTVHLYTLRFMPPADIKPVTKENLVEIRDEMVKLNSEWEDKIFCFADVKSQD